METPKADACYVPQEMNRKAKGTKKPRGKADFTKKRISAYNALVFVLAVLSLCFKNAEKNPQLKKPTQPHV